MTNHPTTLPTCPIEGCPENVNHGHGTETTYAPRQWSATVVGYITWVGREIPEVATRVVSRTIDIWGVAYNAQPGQTPGVEEWFESRQDAVDRIEGIRARIAGDPDQTWVYEPMLLMRSTRTTFDPIEAPWEQESDQPPGGPEAPAPDPAPAEESAL